MRQPSAGLPVCESSPMNPRVSRCTQRLRRVNAAAGEGVSFHPSNDDIADEMLSLILVITVQFTQPPEREATFIAQAAAVWLTVDRRALLACTSLL